jgi:C1A family cysteine protease
MTKYSCKKSKIDQRDFKFHLKFNLRLDLPNQIDLRETTFVPPPLDQGDIGACTANAASNALRFCLKKERAIDFQPSRLYIYFFGRLLENSVEFDSGCELRDILKAIHTYGACSEELWPYDTSKFKDLPYSKCVRAGKEHIANFSYLSVNQNLLDIKNALYRGFPIIFGMYIYESFPIESEHVPMPNVSVDIVSGAHALMIIGCDDQTQTFIVQNSWGPDVGANGYFLIPYSYILEPELAFDFWTIVYF